MENEIKEDLKRKLNLLDNDFLERIDFEQVPNSEVKFFEEILDLEKYSFEVSCARPVFTGHYSEIRIFRGIQNA